MSPSLRSILHRIAGQGHASEDDIREVEQAAIRRVASEPEAACARPIECTREAGHEGPCRHDALEVP